MSNVEFQNFSVEVKAALDDVTIAWLHEWSNEIASHAKRNCTLKKTDVGVDLRAAYKTDVDEAEGLARIGNPHEAAYWEEFGTGSYADVSKNGGKRGRQGWWVYVEGEHTPRSKQTYYSTQEEAEAIAASMRDEGIPAHATNGREPSYTLEKAFLNVKPKALRDLERKLKEKLGR